MVSAMANAAARALTLMAMVALVAPALVHAAEVEEESKLGDNYFGIPRYDASNGMEEYKGGFELDNTNYMMSTVTVGIPGFAIAILMIVVMALMLVIRIASLFCGLCCKCCKKAYSPMKYSNRSLKIMKGMILLLTVLCAVGCILIYTGGPQLTSSINDVASVMGTSVKLLKANVTTIADKLDAAADELKGTGLADDMTSITVKLLDALNTVDEQVDKSRKDLKEYMDMGAQGFMAVAGVIIVVALLGCLTGVMGWTKLLLLTIIIASLILILTWIFMGLCSIVLVIADDLCNSMKAYIIDPEGSDLGSFIPCMDAETSIETMDIARQGIRTLVVEVNAALDSANTEMQNVCNQIGCTPTAIPLLCEIYGKMTKGAMCADSSIPETRYKKTACESTLSSSTNVFPMQTCPNPGSNNANQMKNFDQTEANGGYADMACTNSDFNANNYECIRNGRPIPMNVFEEMGGKIVAAGGLVSALPYVESLIMCDFVMVTFGDMTDGECANLVDSLKLVWDGFTMCGTIYFCLWVTWIVAYQRFNWPEYNIDYKGKDEK